VRIITVIYLGGKGFDEFNLWDSQKPGGGKMQKGGGDDGTGEQQ